MKKKAAFMTFDLSNFMFPLTYEYLTGYALSDPEIKANWDFEYHPDAYDITPSQMAARMAEIGADVYAISCYVWNMGLVREGILMYLKKNPWANIILGGPQVARQGRTYLDAAYQNLALCNGEGEVVFRDYLKEISQEAPDFGRINGISFYKDGELHTTPLKRLQDLDLIPSPYIDRLTCENSRQYDFLYTALETNRGCPFSCNFCTWSILGDKPSKFSDERVRNDIEWIAKQGFPGIFLLDANFGLYPRDTEIAKFVVECKEKYGAPTRFLFLSAYSNSTRLAEIYKILNDAGIHQAGALSVQSMSSAALRAIGRKRFDRFEWFHEFLAAEDIGSYNDILWPVPGETLASFRAGIAELCEKGAGNFMVIPLALLNNTGFHEDREAYGITSVQAMDVNHEADMVLSTREVSGEERMKGWEFAFAATALHVFGGLYLTGRYLHKAGLERYEDLFAAFAEFAISKPDLPFSSCVKMLARENKMDIKHSYDVIIDALCHWNRDAFDRRLHEFASARPWWEEDPTARACFEADLLNRPFLYSDASKKKKFEFQRIQIVDICPQGYVIDMPEDFAETLKGLLGKKAYYTTHRAFVSHTRGQDPFNNSISEAHRLGAIRVSNVFTNAFFPIWKD